MIQNVHNDALQVRGVEGLSKCTNRCEIKKGIFERGRIIVDKIYILNISYGC